jgi:hypothetical protein
VLSRWYTGFLGEFRHHHMVEDDIFFPALAERVDGFGEQVVRLTEEHVRLSGALATVETAMHGLADLDRRWASAHRDAVGALAAASTELDSHLDFEDTDVLPLFVEHMSTIEFDEIEKRASKSLPRSQVAFSVPWLVSQATDDERRHLMKGAPLVLKVLWYGTRRRYARLADAAFGDDPHERGRERHRTDQDERARFSRRGARGGGR